ncbi:MAG: RNase adapter RapZ [Tissierellia bacterium]|nr:RNase adapter RapZ [Tissierellia bacterium]
MELIVITGLSGAGKSSVLDIYEDMGYYAMDNVPPTLLPKFINLCIESNREIDKVAVVLDIRTGSFFKDIITVLDDIQANGYEYKLVFLDARDEVLVKRYKEFRRPHPLTPKGSITEGIDLEREILQELKDKSDFLLDTSNLTNAQLKDNVMGFMDLTNQRTLDIAFVSFGFKNGILLDADLVFDVRFIPNPFYIEDLKPLTGLDQKIIDYVYKWDVTKEFSNKVTELIEFLIPHYISEGKSQLVVGIGCTGGRHRSVAIAEELSKRLNGLNYNSTSAHRDKSRW